MAYEILWDDEDHTILRQRYYGEVPMDDFYEAAKDNEALMRSVSYPVDLIMDFREMTHLNMSGLLSMAQYVNTKVPANQRLAVAVGAGSLVRSLASLMSKVAPRAVRNAFFADSLDEARKIIADQRAIRP